MPGANSKKNKIVDVTITAANDRGKNTFQPSLINWSYLYLGTNAFTIANI